MSYRILSLLFAMLLCPLNFASATSQYFSGHSFNAYVVSPGLRHVNSTHRHGYNQAGNIYVQEGEEYSIVVNNPLPVRVGVVVSVDGLNTIDGKNTSPSQGAKWIIAPYSSIVVKGWQTGDRNLRKFIFRNAADTYASWRERNEGKNYTQNHGVIGIAYFWNSAELHAALNPPNYRLGDGAADRLEMPTSKSRKRGLSTESRDEVAGTGMGRREYNPITSVNFHYNTGMYAANDVLKINYSFRPAPKNPQPFKQDTYRYSQQQYTPEMPY